MTFVIPLADPRVTLRQSIALHFMVAIILCSIGVTSGVLFWFTDVSPTVRGAYLPFGVFGGICFIAGIAIGVLAITARRRTRRGDNGKALRIAELILLVLAAVVFAVQGWNFPALLFTVLAGAVVFALVGEASDSNKVVRFDGGGIYRSFGVRRRRIQWQEVRRVLLRHGALTMDLVDNRLIQYRVAAHGVDPEIFEKWTAEQVEKGKAARPKNDW